MPDKTTVAGELPVWGRLFDSDWINIVNAQSVKDEGNYAHGAACEAAKLTEARLREINEPRMLAATAALAQKDGEIERLRAALQRTTHILDRMGDMPDEFISPAVWREMKCERAIELARAALGSQA